MVSTTFKTRYNNLNHISSFKNRTQENSTGLSKHVWDWKRENRKQENSTGLSKHIWDWKRENKPLEIKWSIASLATHYQKEINKCQLCLTEKISSFLQKEIHH